MTEHLAPADEAREREKFEIWAKANTPLKFERDLASYFSGTTQFAWLAWMERAEEVSAHVEAGEMEAPSDKCDACGGKGLDPACREETCIVCGGTGIVDDGELGFYEGTGIPYECGPIKCVKDCPACGGRKRPATPLPTYHQQEKP